MLPPIEPATLEQNPGFAVLYKDLCKRKLNPDGSTKDVKNGRLHEGIRRNLQEKKTEHAKESILLRTLSDLPARAAELPTELHEVIEIVTAQLSGEFLPEERAILAGDVETFLQHIEPISDAISAQLTVIATHICKIADPISPPPIPSLSSTAQSLLESATQTLPATYAAESVALADLSRQVLDTHLRVAETVIRILEQTMHGSVARANKVRAELLNERGKMIELQARIHTLTHPPPAPFLNALRAYQTHLNQLTNSLHDRSALATSALAQYDRTGAKQIRDIARRKEVLLTEIEKVRDEVGRLERGE